MLILLKILGDYCNGEPPLTIPNREVKPVCADGTAYCGRVGRRLSYLIPSGFPGGIFFSTFFELILPFRQESAMEVPNTKGERSTKPAAGKGSWSEYTISLGLTMLYRFLY